MMNTNLTTLEEGSGNDPVSPTPSTTTVTTLPSTTTMTTISTTTTQIKTTTMPTDDEDLVLGT